MRPTLQKMANLATQFVGLAEQLIAQYPDNPHIQHMREQFRRVGGAEASAAIDPVELGDAEVLDLDDEVQEALSKGMRSVRLVREGYQDRWLAIDDKNSIGVFHEEPTE